MGLGPERAVRPSVPEPEVEPEAETGPKPELRAVLAAGLGVGLEWPRPGEASCTV